MFPGDSFSLVLLLFLLQNQLDEELLQLLIAVVDAELLEAAGERHVTIGLLAKRVSNVRAGADPNLLFWKISKP